ncbi:MAG: metallophosphoesterase [Ignavibacteriales bacterium]|nr:MAG: metallophosphoesterase [Ignavibacteriales bacterium]
MKKLVHISDLHFGKENKIIAGDLIRDIKELSPDLVVVSGDLTQRARTRQFKSAKEYLERIPFKKITTPGNHDIPLFDIFRRIFFPLSRYKKYITEDMYPLYTDDEIAIMAINSARSLTWKNGRISPEQISEIENKLCSIDDTVFKIIVTHHPFIPPPGDPGIDLVGRSSKALTIIDECKVDLLLAGHIHHGYSGDVRPFYPKSKRSVISVQAGTAISNRIREEPNAFNFLSITKTFFTIEIRVWNGEKFIKSKIISYKKKGEEWVRENQGEN